MKRALPSLEAILVEVRAERKDRLKHYESLDQKAGIVLGFAGVFIALSPAGANLLVDLGRISAVISAGSALTAFWPRSYIVTNLRLLRDKYLAAEEVFTLRRILDTQIAMTEETFGSLRSKARRLKVAMSGLATSVVFVTAGLVVT